MRKLYTLCLVLIAGTSMAQVPTNFGSDAEDGITYINYNLIDHGVVSSVRFMAQNAIGEGVAKWEFYTGDYMNNWRPYSADDTLSGYNAIIDPAVETASARYNSNYGGGTGRMPAVQAGYYYTCIIQNGSGDNNMSIIETDFAPVSIDTVYVTPTDPTTADNITITVELGNALTLSPGEHVFIRASPVPDFSIGASFTEITNFANGVGTATVPAGTIPAGITVHYYALVTAEATPDHATIDYFTLFFGNNSGLNYSFTVSAVTGIEDETADYAVIRNEGQLTIRNLVDVQTIRLVSLDGKVVATQACNGQTTATVQTSGLADGIYVLEFLGADFQKTMKVALD